MKVNDIKKFQVAIDQIYNSSKYKSLREQMDRHVEYYRGHFWNHHPHHHKPYDSEIYVNYIFSTVNTIAPLLTDNRPTWHVRGRKEYTQRYFDMFNDALEYLWDSLEASPKLYKAVVCSLLMKVGIWKITYDPDVSATGEVRIDVVDPRTFIIADGYDDPWEAPWCGTYGPRPLSWVWDRFPEKAEEVTAELAKDDSGIKYDRKSWSDEDSIGKEVNIYEIYVKDDTVEDAIDAEGHIEVDKEDKKRKKYPNGRYLIFTKDTKLFDEEYKYKHAKAPFISFIDYWNPFEFHGQDEADQIETLNLEFNLQLKKVANYCRRFVGLNIFKQSDDGIDAEQFKKEIAEGDDNVWEIGMGREPPVALKWPMINRSVLEFISAIPRLIEEVSGVTDVSKGMMTKKERQTASEIATLIESSYTRTRQRVRNLESSIKRACYLFVSLMQQFYTEPRSFTKRDGQNLNYGTVTSNPRYLQEIMKPPENPVLETEADMERQTQLEGDYDKFLEIFGTKNPVYAEFDVEIQTNSTLPIDKQTFANLFMRLFEMKGIDRLALLKQLQVPNAVEIDDRMTQLEQGAQNATNAPAGPPAGAVPLGPSGSI